MANVLLQVSDWNYQDKYYELSPEHLGEFAARIKADGIEEAWQWFVDLVEDKTVKRCDEAVNHRLDDYFLDYNDPLSCIEDWEEQKCSLVNFLNKNYTSEKKKDE